MTSIPFQAVAWEGGDSAEGLYVVRIFGRAEDGRSVSLGTRFNPYFYLKTDRDLKNAVKAAFYKDLVSCEVNHGRDLWGFQNGALSRFLRIEFKSHKGLRNCAWCI